MSEHFLLHPASSWLGQLAADVDDVVQYVPGVMDLVRSGREIPALLSATREDPKWCISQVRRINNLGSALLAAACFDLHSPRRTLPFQGLVPPSKAPHIFGPALPTASARMLHREPSEDDTPDSLGRPYFPTPDITAWQVHGGHRSRRRFLQQRPKAKGPCRRSHSVQGPEV